MKDTGIVRNIDEMGRIEKMEIARRNLGKNDREVLENCIASLKNESKKNEEEDDPFADLRRLQNEARKNREKFCFREKSCTFAPLKLA